MNAMNVILKKPTMLRSERHLLYMKMATKEMEEVTDERRKTCRKSSVTHVAKKGTVLVIAQRSSQKPVEIQKREMNDTNKAYLTEELAFLVSTASERVLDSGASQHMTTLMNGYH